MVCLVLPPPPPAPAPGLHYGLFPVDPSLPPCALNPVVLTSRHTTTPWEHSKLHGRARPASADLNQVYESRQSTGATKYTIVPNSSRVYVLQKGSPQYCSDVPGLFRSMLNFYRQKAEEAKRCVVCPLRAGHQSKAIASCTKRHWFVMNIPPT